MGFFLVPFRIVPTSPYFFRFFLFFFSNRQTCETNVSDVETRDEQGLETIDATLWFDKFLTSYCTARCIIGKYANLSNGRGTLRQVAKPRCATAASNYFRIAFVLLDREILTPSSSRYPKNNRLFLLKIKFNRVNLSKNIFTLLHHCIKIIQKLITFDTSSSKF